MSNGKFKYELSESELKERGQRLAIVLGRIELRTEERKIAVSDIQAQLKALRQEAHTLSLAIREGCEWRDEAEQTEMELMLAECETCFHQHRYAAGTLLDDKPCENCGLIGSMREKE